jgi:hypothetical protein
MGYSAKSLAQHVRGRCLREFGDETKQKYAPGDHFYSLSNVFRGAPIKAPEEGVYHFTISEEIMDADGRSSETQWRCVIYVTRGLDIFMDECEEFGRTQGLPTKKMLRHIISCAVGDRD